ncbi:MAG: hypothetical protein GWQ08_25095 [Verrucomicrobiaceae bacterium]|nr:hypothetical protein [Verrucomicrobiaceae bacterium]
MIGQGVAYVRTNELLARGTTEAEPPREWVELFNGSTQGQDLSGYRLRQGDDEFVIETLQMDAGGFAVIQPSIRLRGRGGDLVLLAPDGDGFIASLDPEYPPQFTGVSYSIDARGERAFFVEPTPGRKNGNGYLGVCAEPLADRERGFYEKPFIVKLESSAPGTVILYTLDGYSPYLNRRKVYSEGIPNYKTMALRAVALRKGCVNSRVITHTYLFLDQAITQPARPRRFPNQWGVVFGLGTRFLETMRWILA